MQNPFLDIFRIDSLGKRIFSKAVFTILLLIKCSVSFFPLGDTDFTPFLVWFQNAVNDPNLLMTTTYDQLPLSIGNYIYIAHVALADFALIVGGMIYCGVYIRQYRKEHGLKDPGDSGYLIPPPYLKPIRVGNLILRIVILSFCLLIIYVPAMIFVLYLFLVFLVIVPCIGMYPACYLSGDRGFFESFKEMVKVTQGYYLINARFMSILLCVYFIGDWITTALGQGIPAVGFVLGPLVGVIMALSFGRYVGIIYCRMREVPGGLIIRNQASR